VGARRGIALKSFFSSSSWNPEARRSFLEDSTVGQTEKKEEENRGEKRRELACMIGRPGGIHKLEEIFRSCSGSLWVRIEGNLRRQNHLESSGAGGLHREVT